MSRSMLRTNFGGEIRGLFRESYQFLAEEENECRPPGNVNVTKRTNTYANPGRSFSGPRRKQHFPADFPPLIPQVQVYQMIFQKFA